MRLIELFKQLDEHLLLEDRIDFLRDLFVKNSEFTDAQNKGFFKLLLDADPSPRKKYLQWLIKLFLSNQLKTEDLYKATSYLEHLAMFNNQLPINKRDINNYKSLQELYDAIKGFNTDRPPSNKQKERELDQAMHQDDQITLVYNSPTMKVVILKTQEASCYFGKNTQWCTAAATGNNAFGDYNNDDPLYIILIKKENKRFQFHFNTKSFMDETDSPIDMVDFLKTYPEIKKVFTEARLLSMLPIYEQYRLAQNTITPSIEKQIINAFEDGDVYIGAYDEDTDSFSIGEYNSVETIATNWQSEGVAALVDANYYDEYKFDDVDGYVSQIFSQLNSKQTQKLFDELESRYEESGQQLSEQDREELEDRSYNVDEGVRYYSEDLQLEDANSLLQIAEESAQTELAAAANYTGRDKAIEYYENLGDHLVDSNGQPVPDMTMTETHAGYDLMVKASYIVELLSFTNDEIYDGWEHLFTAEEMDIPHDGWGEFNEKNAFVDWAKHSNDAGWNFL